MIFSSSSGFICPCPTATRASGTVSCMIISNSARLDIRLLTKNTCPLRLISEVDGILYNFRTERMHFGLYRVTVRRRCLYDTHVTSPSENCNVLGIGVADIVSVSTFTFIWRSFFCRHANFCSSSMISNPKSLNLTDLPISLCVPIKMSTFSRLQICQHFLRLFGTAHMTDNRHVQGNPSVCLKMFCNVGKPIPS